MPRKLRERSITGFYHVMGRGHNKDELFLDAQDYFVFSKLLYKTLAEKGCSLHAYCLMPNHYHLLLREEEQPLPQVMKQIDERYAMYFNAKYDRLGAVFQGRYKSKPVTTDTYLLDVVRYIHQNPVVAGLAKNMLQYRWSSYKDYVMEGPTWISTATVLSVFAEYGPHPFDEFIAAHSIILQEEPKKEKKIHKERQKRLEAAGKLWNRMQKTTLSAEQKLLRLKEKFHCSEREVEQITNISRYKFKKLKQGQE